jgi:hypothetical protein
MTYTPKPASQASRATFSRVVHLHALDRHTSSVPGSPSGLPGWTSRPELQRGVRHLVKPRLGAIAISARACVSKQGSAKDRESTGPIKKR